MNRLVFLSLLLVSLVGCDRRVPAPPTPIEEPGGTWEIVRARPAPVSVPNESYGDYVKPPSIASRKCKVNVCNEDRCVTDSGNIISVENGMTEIMTGAFLGLATFAESHVTIEFDGSSYSGKLVRIDKLNDVAIYRVDDELVAESQGK